MVELGFVGKNAYPVASAMEGGGNLGAGSDLLERKLQIQMDYWASDKRQLEDLLFKAERASNLREALHSYEAARVELVVDQVQEELLLANARLESALDDIKHLSCQLELLRSEVTGKRAEVASLKADARKREAFLIDREADHVRESLERGDVYEKTIQELTQQLATLQAAGSKELEKVKQDHEQWKSQLSDNLVSLVRERDFVWNQLKHMELNYCNQLKAKEDKLQQSLLEVRTLKESAESMEKLADERGVELTILRLNLQKAEEDCMELKDKLIILSNNKEPEQATSERQDTSSNLQVEHHQPNNAADELSAKKNDELRKARQRVEDLSRENAKLKSELESLRIRSEAGKKAARNLRSELEEVSASGKRKRRRNTGTEADSSKKGMAARCVSAEKPRKRQTKRKASSEAGSIKAKRKTKRNA